MAVEGPLFGVTHEVVELGLGELPVIQVLSQPSLAAGGTTHLDASTIPVGLTARLDSVIVGASVPCKYVVKEVVGIAEVTKAVIFTSIGKLTEVVARENMAESEDGGAFRVSVTNLDAHRTADVYATLAWREFASA